VDKTVSSLAALNVVAFANILATPHRKKAGATKTMESMVCKAVAAEQFSPRWVGRTLAQEVVVPRLGLAIREAGAKPPEEADAAGAEAVEEAERPVALVVRVECFVQTIAVASNPGVSGHPRVGRGLARELRLLGW